MYHPLYSTTVLPLSPTSEYSSDGSLFAFNPTSLMAAEHNTPSPPPDEPYNNYVDCPPLTHQEAASTAEAARQGSFSWSSDYHLPGNRHSYPSSTRQSLPEPQHPSYSNYGYTTAPGAFPPSSSSAHASLPPLSHPTSRATAYALSSASQVENPFEYSLEPAYSQSPIQRASQDYGSGVAGVGLTGGLRQDEAFDLNSSPSTSFALPSVDSILGPHRTSRTRNTTQPYTYTGSAAARRVNSVLDSPRYDSRSSLLPSATIDNLQQPPRRSTRSPRKAAASGVPLEKNFVCQTCDARFARNHDLTRHHKVHDPVKQYRCGGCDRSFTRKDALKRHSNQKNCGTAQFAADGAGVGPSTTKGRRKATSSLAAQDGAAPSTRSRPSVAMPNGLDGTDDYYSSDQGGHQSGSTFVSPTLSHHQPQAPISRHHHRLRSHPDFSPYSNAANGSHHSS